MSGWARQTELQGQAFSNVGRKITQKELETLGVLVPYAGTLVCSNGGIILFGKDQLREKYFPNAKVRCAPIIQLKGCIQE